MEGNVRGYVYAIVPEWVLDADVSDRAVRLFAILARYVEGNEDGWKLKRRTLCDRLKCSPTTLDRTLRELRACGAVVATTNIRRDDSQGPNTYWLWPMLPGGEGGSQERRGGPSQPWGGVSAPVTSQLREPINESPSLRTLGKAVASPKPFEVEFNEAWEIYPKKVKRIDALKAYQARRRQGVSADDLMAATIHFARDMQSKDDPQFIMAGSRFYGPNEHWREALEQQTTAMDEIWARIEAKEAAK